MDTQLMHKGKKIVDSCKDIVHVNNAIKWISLCHKVDFEVAADLAGYLKVKKHKIIYELN